MLNELISGLSFALFCSLELCSRDRPLPALLAANLLVFQIRVEPSSPGSLQRPEPSAHQTEGHEQRPVCNHPRQGAFARLLEVHGGPVQRTEAAYTPKADDRESGELNY